MTEVGELIDAVKRLEFYKKPIDQVNFQEEVGDVLWYLAVGYKGLDLVMPEVENAELNIKFQDESLEGLLKKLGHHSACFFTYYQSPENGLDYDLARIMAALVKLASNFNFDLIRAAQLNIEKLAKRFPEGFSEDKALNRDKENELSHFQEIE